MAVDKGEKSGGNVNYYLCPITNPKREGVLPYIAECEDIILALDMTFPEGNAFKAIWRSCAERTLGLAKLGGDAIYDAEKVVHYGKLMLAQRIKWRDQEIDNRPLDLSDL